MKKFVLKSLGLLSIVFFISCGGDDDTPVDTTDTQNPSQPTNLRATNKTQTSLQYLQITEYFSFLYILLVSL